MRVAITTETFVPKRDGIVRVACLFADHLQARGLDVMIMAPQLQRGAAREYRGMPVQRVRGIRFPFYPELTIGPPLGDSYEALKAFQPQIVHAFHPAAIGIPAIWMARRLGLPVLASYHLDVARMASHFGVGPLRFGFTRPVFDRLTRWAFNQADYSLAPSRLVQRDMQAIGIRDVGLWQRGVDAERFHPRFRDDAMRALLSQGHPDAPLLIYVGRLSNEKQIDHLRPVLERVPGTRLALVGDGPAREALERHFAGTPTYFAGYMAGDTLSQAYASGDIFVFPSALETFGLVVVEAMAAGLPVVASRVGGIADVVEEGVTGYTFASGDIEALVAGVEQIAHSRARIRQMGAAARAFAETQAWPAMNDEVIAHYERLIAARMP
jgi:glycosyltransferase involved in cell wall biosynthesis